MPGKRTSARSQDFSDPIEAIKFYMDERGLKQRDLIPMIGSRSKVSEVLSGSRSLTMPMARALHRHLGIPAEYLLKEPSVPAGTSEGGIDWRKFPLNEMAKRGWIERRAPLREHAEELVAGLIGRAGQAKSSVTLYRKNDQNRANAKADPYALRAWCWQVMAQANEKDLPAYHPVVGDNPSKLLVRVARLSPAIDGPMQAIKFLTKQGIAVELVQHLPRTHLDGAVMLSDDGRPVIGLTLRYDRIDNFWWVLMHELAHVALHLSKPCAPKTFIDDLSLVGDGGTQEKDADEFAYECLISGDAWEDSGILDNPSPMSVMALAQSVGVHPAIVAGRIRHTLGNYRLLSQFVGSGAVRSMLGQ